MRKTVVILSAVSLLLLSLVFCEDREEDQQNDNLTVYILPKTSDTEDKGSHMPPDD